tara:strand:- start:43 stop:570 length:528 start_codon:yes stop_codon:yes gene_type:complete
MQIIQTKFEGLYFYKRKNYSDKRGYFRELFKSKEIKKKFCFDYISCSQKNVLRGLHIQTTNPQDKLITVFSGKIFDVVVDFRKNSKTFGKYFSVILSCRENKSLLIPAGFAHGFCALEDNSLLHYKCTQYRNNASETGIIWNDKKLNIKWPIKRPILSDKDKLNYTFDDFVNLSK